MRLDLWFWLAGMLLLLIAGGLRASQPSEGNARRARIRGFRAPLALACLGLASLVAGLVWGTRSPGIWPGTTPADGLVLLACGSLVILCGMLFDDSRHVQAGGDARGRAAPEALAMFCAALLVLLAMAAAWGGPLRSTSAQASSWLSGLRIIAASVGLGAWLPTLTEAAWGLRPAGRPPGNEERTSPPGLRAMRAGYPWLTAAWLLGAAWSLAAAAALWRGTPPEAWLTAAWLLGGVYLIAVRGPARLPPWALALLAACGAAAALLQAWYMPLLLP